MKRQRKKVQVILKGKDCQERQLDISEMICKVIHGKYCALD